MMLRTGVLFILASIPLLADLTGRWSAGGECAFSPKKPGFDRRTAALIVGEAKASATELSPKDAIFLPQIFDCMLLLLIHPTGNDHVNRIMARFGQRADCLALLNRGT